jgi:hypothetical protein
MVASDKLVEGAGRRNVNDYSSIFMNPDDGGGRFSAGLFLVDCQSPMMTLIGCSLGLLVVRLVVLFFSDSVSTAHAHKYNHNAVFQFLNGLPQKILGFLAFLQYIKTKSTHTA